MGSTGTGDARTVTVYRYERYTGISRTDKTTVMPLDPSGQVATASEENRRSHALARKREAQKLCAPFYARAIAQPAELGRNESGTCCE